MRMRAVTALLAALALGAPAAGRAAVATPTPTPTIQPSQATPTATPTPTPTATPAPAAARRTKADQRVYDDYSADGVISACRHSVKTLKHTLRTIRPQFETNFPDFRPAVKAAIARHRNGGCRPTPTPHNPGGGTTSPAGGTTPTPTVTPFPTTTPAPSTLQPTAPTESGRLPGGVPRSGGGARTPRHALTPSASATPAGPATAEGAITPVLTPTPTPRRLVVERAGGHDLAVPGALLGLAVLVAVLLGLSALAAARSPRLAGMHHAWREAAYRTRGTWRDFSEWLRLGR